MLALLLALAAASSAACQSYPVVGDAIPQSLTGTAGDPARGRAVVADRRLGLCLLCHSGPIPEQPQQGDLAPTLEGAGARLTPGQLRLRMVDSRHVNPDTIMPPFHGKDTGARTGAAWQGKPILDAQQIEDVVAYLSTLKGDP